MDYWEIFKNKMMQNTPSSPGVELTGVDMPTPGEPVIGKSFSGLFEKAGELINNKREEAKIKKQAPARAERTKEIFKPGKQTVTAPEATISKSATPRPEYVEDRMKQIFDLFNKQNQGEY